MILTSNDFINESVLNKRHTCDGEDISPNLKWEQVPTSTKSFALTCIDLDHEAGLISHWNIINIPADCREISRGGPIPGMEIENDLSTTYYEGPCQPDKIHRYVFRLHALNVEQIEGVTALNFRKLIKTHVLETAEIIGLYQSEIRLKFQSCH